MTSDEILLADGFEDAFLGIGERRGQPSVAVYDAGKCIQVLIDRGYGMSREDAVEYFEFNVLGAWMGERTPLFLYPRDLSALA